MCGAFAIAVLSGCNTPAPPPPPPPVAAEPPAPHQISENLPTFLTLSNIPEGRAPVRVGVILPFGDASAGTRALAGAMLKAAELALYDAGKPDIILMTADETGPSNDAAKAAKALLDQGAEILVGPVFSASAAAVAPLARDRGVPVLAFSTDRTVAGNGIFLLSFQPQNEVERIVSYAAGHGHKKFCGLVPQTAYGDVVEQSFREKVAATGGTLAAMQRYNPAAGAVNDPAAAIAKSACDAILVPQGGSLLRALIPALAYNGVDGSKVKYLGTGLWDDQANIRETLLAGGWFAAPQPSADDAFQERYRKTFGGEAPALASLAYDAVSLAALLSSGTPYRRFTKATITDPNGFAGANGIFRFKPDGTIERGLAVLSVDSGGFTVISPAPTTFQKSGS
jgi:branched-chain amino acid transport system substrate-binding protein